MSTVLGQIIVRNLVHQDEEIRIAGTDLVRLDFNRVARCVTLSERETPKKCQTVTEIETLRLRRFETLFWERERVAMAQTSYSYLQILVPPRNDLFLDFSFFLFLSLSLSEPLITLTTWIRIVMAEDSSPCLMTILLFVLFSLVCRVLTRLEDIKQKPAHTNATCRCNC